MIPFITVLHALVCILLIVIILMQTGRRGGLTESMIAAESLFGAQTNAFMVKATTIFATLFLVTCLSLAFFSSKQNQSLMSNKGIEGGVSKQAGPEQENPSVPAEVPPSAEEPLPPTNAAPPTN